MTIEEEMQLIKVWTSMYRSIKGITPRERSDFGRPESASLGEGYETLLDYIHGDGDHLLNNEETRKLMYEEIKKPMWSLEMIMDLQNIRDFVSSYKKAMGINDNPKWGNDASISDDPSAQGLINRLARTPNTEGLWKKLQEGTDEAKRLRETAKQGVQYMRGLYKHI